jgi:predicted nucleic acid-binding protein
MTVVVNSTPLIYLAAIGKFDLLRVIYDRIYRACLVAVGE